MATQTYRQPFAPLNSSRLQNLTSLKNRQNAVNMNILSSPTKRKATTFDLDNITDFSNENNENINPLSPSVKKSKAVDGSATYSKPVNYFLTPAPPSPNDFSCLKPVVASPKRTILNARSPIRRIDTQTKNIAPLSAPAGRSPTRKRVGILNRRKTTNGSTFARVDPPKFSAGKLGEANGLGFSIDAALSGTIPSYTPRGQTTTSAPAPSVSIQEGLSKGLLPELYTGGREKESWFFDIHEDTEEELATNLMEHSTCTLDLSSDEESRVRERDERGKENVPPMDDISQTRTVLTSSSSSSGMIRSGDMKTRVSRRKEADLEDGKIDVDRSPLGDLAAEDFYAEGCDEKSVILIPAEESSSEEDQEAQGQEQDEVPIPESFDFLPPATEQEEEVPMAQEEAMIPQFDIETLMSRDAMNAAPKAALLMPIEKAEDGFEVWESGSAKGDE